MKEFAFVYRGAKRIGSAEQQQKTLQKWGAWMTELNQRGVISDAGQPLEDTGKCVQGPDRVVHDGPFPEIKDLVNGFTIITANDISEATEIAKGCPIFDDGGGIEVRPVQVYTR